MLIFPLFIPHRGCPQTCIYCDQYQISGVVNPDWDFLLLQLKRFCHLHFQEEKEIALYGGSFTCLPLLQQAELYDKILPFLDDNTHLRYSTRPDGISPAILRESFFRGVRTIELGVQDFNDHVLEMTHRGYHREQALSACKMVKSFGLKLSVQLMPGLPGYDSSVLSSMIEDTISVHPDYVRIYPTIVIAGTPLEVMYHNGEYTPLTLNNALNDTSLMIDRFEAVGIKVIKIGLTGVQESNVIAGPFHHSFGELVRSESYIKKILSRFEPQLVLSISKMDMSLLLGHKKEYLTRIKHHFNLSSIKIKLSESLKKGEFQCLETDEFLIW